MIEYKKLLREMTAIPSVSGFERKAAETLIPAVKEYFDEVLIDPVGNLILKKTCGKEDAPRIMLDAHFDEVGFIVSEITDGGFVKVEPVGGIDPSVLSSTEVVIYGREPVYGLFCVTPPHLVTKDDEGKLPKVKDMMIETGYEKEKLEKIVAPGDPVGYRAVGDDLSFGVVAGRGFDDKSCGAALICAVADTPRDDLAGDVYVTLSSREETGGGGASAAARSVDPDFAVVTDVNFAKTPGVETRESGERGKGPMVSLSAVTCRRLTLGILKMAEKAGIPVQTVVESSNTGTNANLLLITGDGVPVAVVSLPLGGMHTFSETLSLDDAELFIKLIKEIIKSRPLAGEWCAARSPSVSVFDGLHGGEANTDER
ncbi:MAG: M20/M25/M40 family metallo-hydrolase [Clostridia bacterium]|nr:M20/M25/M40 family metallo-hydrolase [Clostridia bacterium]MBR7033917.1 M20/M25/M40 family metallo-hydrolase [Clostridia bacterium]